MVALQLLLAKERGISRPKQQGRRASVVVLQDFSSCLSTNGGGMTARVTGQTRSRWGSLVQQGEQWQQHMKAAAAAPQPAAAAKQAEPANSTHASKSEAQQSKTEHIAWSSSVCSSWP
jgi:hypothetical protein